MLRVSGHHPTNICIALEVQNQFFTGYFSCFCSTASNSNRSSPACSPVLRKRSRSPTPQSPEGENMVEKSSDHSSDKSPSTPEQAIQRTYSQSLHTSRPGGKNSKVNECDCAFCTSALPVFIYCMSCTLTATVGSNFIAVQVLKSTPFKV